MVCCWTFAAIILIVVHLIFHGKSRAIFGIYSQKNVQFYFKFAFMYAAIKLRKYLENRKRSENTTGYGVKLKDRVEDMDCVLPLPPDAPKAADAVYFVGASKSETYFVAATARRQNNLIDAFWYLRLPEIGLLEAPKLPDTTLEADEPNAFAAGGLKIEPIKPMKEWKITYNGPMKLNNELINVNFNFSWTTELPYFDFDSDIPVATIAKALALEPWSRSYFQRLKTSHQTHHEQMGTLAGSVEVEKHGKFNLKLDCMRDHSFALKRDWRLMHRYGLHSVHVEDGTKFCVGIISHPDIFSSFEMGYLYAPNGRLYGVDWCDLELWRHGEGGTPPRDYAFNFQAGLTRLRQSASRKTYRVECEVLESPELFIGPEWEARVVERMCRYRVNGKAAWGFAEWEYRHHAGRPIQK